MQSLESIELVDKFIEEKKLAFLYISRPNCGVCQALLPKVETLLEDFPEIRAAYINADYVEEIAGRLSIFTVPVLLLFVDGKEVLREARFVHLDQLQDKLEKIYSLTVD